MDRARQPTTDLNNMDRARQPTDYYSGQWKKAKL